MLSDCIKITWHGSRNSLHSEGFFSLFFIIPIGFISHTTPRKTRQKKLLSNFVAIKINMAYGNGPKSAYKVANRISNNPARIVSLAVSFYLSLSLFFFGISLAAAVTPAVWIDSQSCPGAIITHAGGALHWIMRVHKLIKLRYKVGNGDGDGDGCECRTHLSHNYGARIVRFLRRGWSWSWRRRNVAWRGQVVALIGNRCLVLIFVARPPSKWPRLARCGPGRGVQGGKGGAATCHGKSFA